MKHLRGMPPAHHWVCECGARGSLSADFRFNGLSWEHHHDYPVGHVPMTRDQYGLQLNDELRVLATLANRKLWQWDEGNCWLGFKNLAKAIRRTEVDARETVRSLRDGGYLKLLPTWNMDGELSGSGYFLTTKFYAEFGRRR